MITHTDVRFLSGEDQLAGRLHSPASSDPPHPAVVLGHGFGGTRVAGLDRYAEKFARGGMVALAFDYRGFGESGGRPRQLLSIRRQLDDWRAALEFAADHPMVDPERVALWGTSFSGGHVVRVAADNPRVAAVVSQVPFMDGLQTALRLPFISALKAAGLGLADLVKGGLLRRSPVTMPLVARPGRAAAMALDQAVEGIARLYGEHPWENRVCARIGLAVPLYRPVRWAGRVRCPLLIQVGEHDTLTPPKPARKAAERAPRGEFRSHPWGHFDFYFDEAFKVTSDEQVAFLRRHLDV